MIGCQQELTSSFRPPLLQHKAKKELVIGLPAQIKKSGRTEIYLENFDVLLVIIVLLALSLHDDI